jgi:hypothetical protein
MRFYKQPHAFYTGVDLRATSMFIDDCRACETKPTLTITTRKIIPKCHRGRNVAHPSGAR